MELLDIPLTLSGEAIMRFYRYNTNDLFTDLKSIIEALVDKIRKLRQQILDQMENGAKEDNSSTE